MLVSLACTFFWIYDLSKAHLFYASYSQKLGVFPTLQELEIINNSFAMVFARKRVILDILEHPQSLKKLDFSSYDQYFPTQFVT